MIMWFWGLFDSCVGAYGRVCNIGSGFPRSANKNMTVMIQRSQTYTLSWHYNWHCDPHDFIDMEIMEAWSWRWHVTGLETCTESLRSHCVTVKPKLQFKPYDIGDTRIMEYLLKESARTEWSKRGYVRYRRNSGNSRRAQDQWSPDASIRSSRWQTWNCGVLRLPCWGSGLLQSDLS